ncbi:hypothetical protein PLEOSDRAFT_1086926 [Pleurotus ostreatus PC15]|uniref:Uncharacterized protein n=1 Tax=Pleurotus ostreatus (strain PC15) TaxID=1137138 RepID=A0A067N2F6_PLEO1|nr:hypothetical protein PLEOSDRAFT_1086926 [Pleurotus ostreatus PC15]
MTWVVPMGVGSVYGWSPMRGNRALGIAQLCYTFVQQVIVITKHGMPCRLQLHPWTFPSITMPGVLANAGVHIVNYPVGVIFPGHEKDKQRGITAASTVHIDSILEHLSPSAAQQIRFELIPDAVVKRYADKHGKLPVIINAAPQPQSKFVQGSRLLADSSVDDQGPWQLKPRDQEDSPNFVESVDKDGPSKARTRIRKHKERAPPICFLVVIPTPRKRMPDATSTPRPIIKATSKSKSQAAAPTEAGSLKDTAPVPAPTGPPRKALKATAPAEAGSSKDAAPIAPVPTPSGPLKKATPAASTSKAEKLSKAAVHAEVPDPKAPRAVAARPTTEATNPSDVGPKAAPLATSKADSAPNAASQVEPGLKPISGSKGKAKAHQRSSSKDDAKATNTATTYEAENPLIILPTAVTTVMMSILGTSESASMQTRHIAVLTPHMAVNVVMSALTAPVDAPSSNTKMSQIAAPTPHAAANVATSPMTAAPLSYHMKTSQTAAPMVIHQTTIQERVTSTLKIGGTTTMIV